MGGMRIVSLLDVFKSEYVGIHDPKYWTGIFERRTEWIQLSNASLLAFIVAMVIQNRTPIILTPASQPLFSFGLKKSFKELCQNGDLLPGG